MRRGPLSPSSLLFLVFEQIANQAHLGRRLHQSWPVHAWFGTQHRAEVDGQHVAFNDLHVRAGGKLHAQLRRQHAVEFDGNYPTGTVGEQGSQRATSGADLDHRFLGNVT